MPSPSCGSSPATPSRPRPTTRSAARSRPRTTCRPASSTCRSSTRRTARSRSSGAEKGDVLAVADPLDRAARAAARRHHRADPRVRRPGRHPDHRHAQPADRPSASRRCEVTPEGVVFSDEITLPYEPFIGTWASARDRGGLLAASPTTGAATWTCPTWRRARSSTSRSSDQDAYLYLGDCHGAQGDGELCGVAVEIAGDDHDPARPDQGLEHRLAAAGERATSSWRSAAPGRWRTPPASPIAS